MIKFAIRSFLFILFLLALDNWILGSCFVTNIIDKYRPDGTSPGLSQAGVVQKQAFHILALAKKFKKERKVIFIGSSAVVNGIDEQVIRKTWETDAPELLPLNYGMTSLLAYEVPMMRRYLFSGDTVAIVYLYNSFSFSNHTHPQAAYTRWNTLEFLRILPLENWRSLKDNITGLFGEIFFTIRTRDFLQGMMKRAFLGQLSANKSDFDYLPGPVLSYRLRKPTPPDTGFYREIYTDSPSLFRNIGYNGLERFITLGRKNGVEIIVMPAPEPEFSNYTRRQGIDVARIDANVRFLCEKYGAVYIPRSEISHIEQDDAMFRDDVHLDKPGRDFFSDWLAKRILKIVQKP